MNRHVVLNHFRNGVASEQDSYHVVFQRFAFQILIFPEILIHPPTCHHYTYQQCETEKYFHVFSKAHNFSCIGFHFEHDRYCIDLARHANDDTCWTCPVLKFMANKQHTLPCNVKTYFKKVPIVRSSSFAGLYICSHCCKSCCVIFAGSLCKMMG